MKVALVTSVPAFPTSAGNRSRIRELSLAVRQLGHELTFVFIPSERDVGDPDAHVAAFGANHFIRITNGGKLRERLYRIRLKSLAGVAKALRLLGVEAGYYSRLDKTYNHIWTRQLAEALRDADAVIVEYVFNSKVFDAAPNSAKKILDTHDAFGERHKPYVASGIKTGYWTSLRMRDENRGFRRAQSILAIQEEEAVRFHAQLIPDGGAMPEIEVVSHFLNTCKPVSSWKINNRAVFLASNNPSNRQAIWSFIENVLPRVVNELPDFQLRLVGRICDAVTDHPNVLKLGRVGDLQQAFTEAPLSINPMLVGTGINIKLLDAMALAVPTISTRTGVRGLPEASRGGVIVVSDEDHVEFSKQLIRLATDPDLRREFGAKALADAIIWNKVQLATLERCLQKS